MLQGYIRQQRPSGTEQLEALWEDKPLSMACTDAKWRQWLVAKFYQSLEKAEQKTAQRR